MTAKPWVGMPIRYDPATKRYQLVRHYVDAIEWAGGLAVMIPVTASIASLEDYGDRLDALLLPGNPSDIDPGRYGQPAHGKLGPVVAERDRCDFALLDIAQRRRLPVLGICFGAQSLNVFHGGTLVQDIPSELPDALAHDREGVPTEVKAHPVRIEEGSWLRRLAGSDRAEVNSFHHQSIARPGRGLTVTASAPDGVVEAVEGGPDRFVVGVQWHPETGWRSDAFAGRLFRALVEAAVR